MSGYIGPKTSDVPIGTISTKGTVSGNNIVVGGATVNSTVFTGTANNTSFVGSVSAANVVSNAQLTANLANYLPLAGGTISGNLATSNIVTVGNSTVNSIMSSSYYQFNSITSTAFSILKPTSNSTYNSRFDITPVGGNNAIQSGPWWNGLHLSPSGLNYANGSFAYPRTSLYYSYTNTTTPTDMYFGIVAGNDGGFGTAMKFYATGTDSVQRGIDIAANGNVGIGTTTPLHKLHVSGNGFFVDGTLSSGNPTSNGIHIGRQGDYSTIELVSNTGTLIDFGKSGEDYRGRLIFDNASNTFSINSANAFNIIANGNTGIGYTSPLSKLHVANEIRVGRVDASQEGGEIKLCRSSDDAAQYSIDVYGSGSSPALRMFDSVGGTVFLNASPTGVNYIKFNPTQAASGDANALDDYEEGTWTPTYLGSTSNPTVSYSEQLGSYIKIGRLVVCFVKIVKSSASGGSGSLMLGGLPFTASSPGYGMASRIISWNWSPASPDYKADQLYVNQGSTTAMVWDVATNTITVATMVAGAGTIITGMFSYYTSA